MLVYIPLYILLMGHGELETVMLRSVDWLSLSSLTPFFSHAHFPSINFGVSAEGIYFFFWIVMKNFSDPIVDFVLHHCNTRNT